MTDVPHIVREGVTIYPNSPETAHIDLWYPGIHGNPDALQIGLMHVRAADDIRISYDFDRDGWKVEQAYLTEEPAEDYTNATIEVEHWEEVAFVRAWDLNRQKGTTGPGAEDDDREA